MKKGFIVSKIEASEDGSQYVLVAFIHPNEPKSAGGAGEGTLGYIPTFKITMKEYEDMVIKVGDRVGIEIKKVDGSGV
jgi:hypothetical protein